MFKQKGISIMDAFFYILSFRAKREICLYEVRDFSVILPSK